MLQQFFSGVIQLILGFLVIAFFAFLVSFLMAYCWNYIIPFLFHLPLINWKQAWCLMFVSGMLFKSNATSSK